MELPEIQIRRRRAGHNSTAGSWGRGMQLKQKSDHFLLEFLKFVP
jgi:hypothetical protein